MSPTADGAPGGDRHSRADRLLLFAMADMRREATAAYALAAMAAGHAELASSAITDIWEAGTARLSEVFEFYLSIIIGQLIIHLACGEKYPDLSNVDVQPMTRHVFAAAAERIQRAGITLPPGTPTARIIDDVREGDLMPLFLALAGTAAAAAARRSDDAPTDDAHGPSDGE